MNYNDINQIYQYDILKKNKQAELLSNARISSNKKISQESMAEYLGMSKNSVYNIEIGKKELNILEMIMWMNHCGINTFRPIVEFCVDELDNITHYDSDERITNALHIIIEIMPTHHLKSVSYMLTGNHESNPLAMMDEIAANLQTPIYDRHNIVDLILANYDISHNDLDEKPDMDVLNKAAHAGWGAFEKSNSGYSLTIENKELFIHKFAEYLKKTRKDAHISAEQMSFAMNVSKNTVHNIESGKRMLSLWESIKWLKVCGTNNFKTLFSFLFYPYYKNDYVDEEAVAEAHEIVNHMSPHTARLLLFLFLGEHGSDPYAVIDEFLANISCKLESRYMVARQVFNNYKRTIMMDNYSSPDHEQPDLDAFKNGMDDLWDRILQKQMEFANS